MNCIKSEEPDIEDVFVHSTVCKQMTNRILNASQQIMEQLN